MQSEIAPVLARMRSGEAVSVSAAWIKECVRVAPEAASRIITATNRHNPAEDVAWWGAFKPPADLEYELSGGYLIALASPTK